MKIGTNIKSIRKLKKLTQIELAKKANISRSYLADVEGNRYNPSIETLISISNALNIPISDLFEDHEKKSFSIKEIAVDEKRKNAIYKIKFFNGFQYDQIEIKISFITLPNDNVFFIEFIPKDSSVQRLSEYITTFFTQSFIDQVAINIINTYYPKTSDNLEFSNNPIYYFIWKDLRFDIDTLDYKKTISLIKNKFYIL